MVIAGFAANILHQNDAADVYQCISRSLDSDSNSVSDSDSGLGSQRCLLSALNGGCSWRACATAAAPNAVAVAVAVGVGVGIGVGHGHVSQDGKRTDRGQCTSMTDRLTGWLTARVNDGPQRSAAQCSLSARNASTQMSSSAIYVVERI